MNHWLERLEAAKRKAPSPVATAPELPAIPSDGDLTTRVGACLQSLGTKHGTLGPQEWLELCRQAHATCVATFPQERRHNALRGYIERYCEGQNTAVISAHTLALWLWAKERSTGRGTPNGACLEAACKACGVDVDRLPENEAQA